MNSTNVAMQRNIIVFVSRNKHHVWSISNKSHIETRYSILRAIKIVMKVFKEF
jgi:hypothetical protein